MLFAEITTADGHEGLGFSYSKRAGGPGQFAHAKEIAPALIGEDPSDIARLWNKLCWAGASVGRSGLSTQAIGAFDVALYDLKAKRAGLSLAKLLGAHRDSVACYNTSGGFLHTPLDQLLVNAAASIERGIGGIKLKVGQPDRALDIKRVEAVRKHLGDDVPLMVDANQQWDRPTAQRMCRIFEQFNLVWIEEPLDAYDHEGHAALAAQFDTPIATGEMLTSVAEHGELIRHRAADYLMPDAPRVGGITPFLKIAAQAEQAGLMLGPALRDGAARAPGCGLPDRAVGRALRLARAAVQRAARDQGRPHARADPAGPRRQLERAGARLDARAGRVRRAALDACASSSRVSAALAFSSTNRGATPHTPGDNHEKAPRDPCPRPRRRRRRARQAWPAKPVTLLVPFPPGGSTDMIARTVGAKLQEKLGGTFVVDNKAGAGGTIGAAQAKRAAPDGYTIFVSSLGPFVIGPHLVKSAGLRPAEGLRLHHRRRAGAQRAGGAGQLAAQDASPTCLKFLKANPEQDDASPRRATARRDHLTAELFWQETGTKAVHVPYKGGAPAMSDLLGGQVDATFMNINTGLPQHQGRQAARAGDHQLASARRCCPTCRRWKSWASRA